MVKFIHIHTWCWLEVAMKDYICPYFNFNLVKTYQPCKARVLEEGENKSMCVNGFDTTSHLFMPQHHNTTTNTTKSRKLIFSLTCIRVKV